MPKTIQPAEKRDLTFAWPRQRVPSEREAAAIRERFVAILKGHRREVRLASLASWDLGGLTPEDVEQMRQPRDFD